MADADFYQVNPAENDHQEQKMTGNGDDPD